MITKENINNLINAFNKGDIKSCEGYEDLAIDMDYTHKELMEEIDKIKPDNIKVRNILYNMYTDCVNI